jgi:hypothetical protein
MKANRKIWFSAAVVLAVVAMSSAPAFGWTVNQHYPNLTPDTAYDLTKIIPGSFTITDAMLNRPFARYQSATIGGFTYIHWDSGAVPPGDTGHACFTTADDEYPPVVISLWTDSLGNFIGPAGPVVGGYLYMRALDEIRLIVKHDWAQWTGDDFPLEPTDTIGTPYGAITMTDVYYAIHDEELPMEALNDSLWGPGSGLTWNLIDEDTVLDYGDSLAYDLPELELGDVLLVRYALEGEGMTSYEVLQRRQDPDDVPTLTEWGFIIFTVLLLGWMAWVIMRRRRTVKVGI